MRMAEGDIQKAEYVLNCSWYDYYNRIIMYNKYQLDKKEEYERQKNEGSNSTPESGNAIGYK